MDFQSALRDFRPKYDYFVGIDSDGCVFDSMEVKQKEFFIPVALKYFNLFPISKIVRETWEFVNLYSVNRGGNRFPSLVKVFDLLSERVEIREMGYKLPDLTPLKAWISSETKLGNASLKKYYAGNKDKTIGLVLDWSEAVNREINEWLRRVPPFRHAVKTIEKLSQMADIIVISQTPLEALEREWIENDIRKYVRMIAAQEHGTKTEHIALAAGGKYAEGKIILIGDAIGDMNAADRNNALFFPIAPGREDYSWENFLEQGLERFLTGTFRGDYQKSLIDGFKELLPEIPPWKSGPH